MAKNIIIKLSMYTIFMYQHITLHTGITFQTNEIIKHSPNIDPHKCACENILIDNECLKYLL